eukprot:7035696-Alexandrium_andersonii.AAC.1
MDAWTISELGLLPAEVRGWNADLFEGVEACGEWPRELAAAEGLVFPTPGGGHDPLERRPIWPS